MARMTQTERIIRMEQERVARDRAMILDPERWPLWPRLPLKRRIMGKHLDNKDLGVLLDRPPLFVVYLGLMFHMPGEDDTDTQQRHQETIIYSDVDALLRDWRVD